MIKLLHWVFQSPLHGVGSYIGAAITYAVVAILIWGYIYRPKLRDASDYAWTNEEVVQYAMLQAIIWPLFICVYVVIAIAAALLYGVGGGAAWLIERTAKALPEPRYKDTYRQEIQSGFRRLK